MKILNLYAGIGGNRKLWKGHEITAVELNPEIAKIYQEFYPNDKVIVTDAHAYLLEHFKEYDFIWSSPPCQTHSIMNYSISKDENKKGNPLKIRYPDMNLYQEIILLTQHCVNKWVIENVKPYYKELVKPMIYLDRHFFWSNFIIYPIEIKSNRKHSEIKAGSTIYNVNIKEKNINNKIQLLRNMVNPEIGKYILDQSMYTGELF